MKPREEELHRSPLLTIKSETSSAGPIDPSMTVAEIVRLHPEAAPVLASFGLDTCCGGSHPLRVACTAKNLPLEAVMEALASVRGQAARADAPAPPLPRATSQAAIDAAMSVRDAIARHPQTLLVFARHGLMGCGGARGPDEPIGWFARVHHVDEAMLLAELNEAASRAASLPRPAPPTREEIRRENFYRRFLKAALLFTFTGGTTLGVWALIDMALRRELGGIGRGIVQVHGHYQLFGWTALFVVGIAYHILPRLTGVALGSYRLASISFLSLSAGTVLRTAQSLDPSGLRSSLLLAGGALELLGCGIFLILAGALFRTPTASGAPYVRWLAAGNFWLAASAILSFANAAALSIGPSFEVPALLNRPYLTVFLLGFVVCWIFGVSLRTLPFFMGLRSRPALASALLLPFSLSVAVLAGSEAAVLSGWGAWTQKVQGLGALGVALCLGLFTWSLGVLGRATGEVEPGVDRRYEKFIRLAYAWLVISAAMVALFGARWLSGHAVEHAFVGAFRHAITVGFITTMIVGMASRIVPVFRGVPLQYPRLLETAFWLIAAGNLIRVLFQSLSGFSYPDYLLVAGLSGPLELGALFLFGVSLWKTMNAPGGLEMPAAASPAISRESRVGELLEAYPQLLPIFVSAGFAPLANPVLRRSLARAVSVGQACRMHGVNLDRFLEELRAALASNPEDPGAQPSRVA